MLENRGIDADKTHKTRRRGRERRFTIGRHGSPGTVDEARDFAASWL